MAQPGSGRFGRLRHHPGDHPGVFWRETLDRRNITQAQMARQTGASPKHINQILQGNALPSADLVVKMAHVLHEDDATEAHNAAIQMFTVQSRYLLQQSFKDLEEWKPYPDGSRRGRSLEGE